MRKFVFFVLCATAATVGTVWPITEPAAAATSKPPPARVGLTVEPELGRCSAGWCSWSILKNRTVAKADATGTLVRLTLLGGTSVNAGRYNGKSRIRWNTSPHEVYVFCSKRLPAVIMKNDIPPRLVRASSHRFPLYQVDILDFVNGIPGVLESSANLFVSTCFPHQDWEDPAFASRNKMPAFEDNPDINISSPEEIVETAKRM